MNEYAVVKVQVKEEHSKECPSPIVLKPQGCQPVPQNIFKFGNRQVYGLGNGLMACPFHATDLPGRESLKNMKPESPFLNLGQSAHCKKLLQGFPGILAVLYVNNSFFPFFIQSASGTMLRFLQTVDRNILAGLGALCPILLIVNLIGQGFQLCKVMFRFVRILLQIILQCDFYDFRYESDKRYLGCFLFIA